jgi:hypothetical protein
MFSQANTCNEIRAALLSLDGVKRVYSAGASGREGIPAALNELPAILVFPGRTRRYEARSQAHHRHEYEVVVQVLQAGGDMATRLATVLPMVDRIIERFTSHVTLGDSVNFCRFDRSEGLQDLEYAGVTYSGYQIFLLVGEQENTSFSGGSP